MSKAFVLKTRFQPRNLCKGGNSLQSSDLLMYNMLCSCLPSKIHKNTHTHTDMINTHAYNYACHVLGAPLENLKGVGQGRVLELEDTLVFSGSPSDGHIFFTQNN